MANQINIYSGETLIEEILIHRYLPGKSYRAYCRRMQTKLKHAIAGLPNATHATMNGCTFDAQGNRTGFIAS